jgi:hypothetical protein
VLLVEWLNHDPVTNKKITTFKFLYGKVGSFGREVVSWPEVTSKDGRNPMVDVVIVGKGSHRKCSWLKKNWMRIETHQGKAHDEVQ